MHKLKTFITLGFKKQLMFIEAFILSGLYRFAILFLPFKYIKKRLGIAKTESTYEVEEADYLEAKQVCSIVMLACKYTPWESKCLIQAMLVQYFLKRRKIPTTIYLGVNKSDLSGMRAHAWIRCGKMIITGYGPKDQFIQVATFSNESVLNK